MHESIIENYLTNFWVMHEMIERGQSKVKGKIIKFEKIYTSKGSKIVKKYAEDEHSLRT